MDAAVVEAFALPFVALTTLVDLSDQIHLSEPGEFSNTLWKQGEGVACEVASWPLRAAL